MHAVKRLLFRPILWAIPVALVSIFFIGCAVFRYNSSSHFSFVGYGGTFKATDLHILGIPIYWFMLLLGFLVSLLFSFLERKKSQMSVFAALLHPIVFLIISIIGAKLLYMVENHQVLSSGNVELSGLSLYGAFFSTMLLTPIFAKISKRRSQDQYDYYTSLFLILLIFVRLGCFFNGCCGAKILWIHSNPIILPVQLFEVTLDIAFFDLCLSLQKKYPSQGYAFPAFTIMYGFSRFFIEFLRKNQPVLLGLTSSQIISVIVIIIAVFMIGFFKRRNNKTLKMKID